jgi:FAD/FMN-containing dehydrogenase
MKLLIGSQGSLAVITSASFKLFPAPRQTRTFLAEFASAPEALSFRDAILRSPLSPMCLELVSPAARDIMKPGMSSATWVICIRAAGSDSVLARYRSELGSAITREIEGQREAELWQAVIAFRESVRAMHPRSLVLSFSLPLRDVQLTIATLESVAEFHGLDIALIGRAGIGHLEAALWPIAKQEASLANLVTATSLLRSKLSHDSSMSVLYCPLEARADIPAWGPSPTHLESMRAVKNALDGKDVLNRGRFLP